MTPQGLANVVKAAHAIGERKENQIGIENYPREWQGMIVTALEAFGAGRGELRTFDTSQTTLRRSGNVFTITCEDGAIANRVADHLRSPNAALEAFGAAQAEQVLGFIKPDNDRQVFFYEQDFYVLSNFSAFRLRWQDRRFDTSEAAYHWEKFCGREPNVAVRIIEARSAHEAFKIAEANKHLRRSDWDDVKVEIMRGILRAKADQHEYVRRKLLATGDRELIEDSWRDGFWGWGPNRDGQNMLGKLWMEVRAELRSSPLPSTHEKPLSLCSRCGGNDPDCYICGTMVASTEGK
jgi:ribA/ribD-fused uncharacterized protein